MLVIESLSGGRSYTLSPRLVWKPGPVVFFSSHEAHSQGEGNCQSLLGTQSLQAWLEKQFLLIDRRACCIHPVNIETHFNTGALLITTPL